MIAEFGQVALILALALAAILATVPLYGAARGNESLMRMAPSLVAGHFVFIAAAFAALSLAFLNHDFSVT
ncbi:MAG: c-type cytochrome biogenesis protein CcmF, partial [Wenzhouxiangella sp.]